MTEKDVKELIEKYLNGNCTSEEKAWIESWYLDLTEKSELPEAPIDYERKEGEIWAKQEQLFKTRSNIRTIWPRIVAAASILMIVSVSAYFIVHKQTQDQFAQINKNDLAPGGNKAILILSNGQKLVLTTAKNGTLATQGGTTINKTADGKIVYNGEDDKASTPISYNTINTPKGGQYWVTLADGTKVLLNAESSLKYPTIFRGKERLVELTGEAYFEVVHNNKAPFKVKTGAQLVEDVGTHFNIKAYNDEPAITTTLLEGAANVSLISNGFFKTIALKPNQQSRINNGNIAFIPDADVALATGWIDGRFRFKDAGIEEVMRELARWYNFEVVYKDTPTDERFNAIISRYRNISSALNILEKTKGVHFKIEGRRVTVLNKF